MGKGIVIIWSATFSRRGHLLSVHPLFALHVFHAYFLLAKQNTVSYFYFGEKMAKLLANQHNLVGRLLNLQKETIKDVNESTSDMHMPLSWDAEPDLSAAVGSMSEASKAVSDCATKLVLVLMVRRK
jgi:hypothetical protein